MGFVLGSSRSKGALRKGNHEEHEGHATKSTNTIREFLIFEIDLRALWELFFVPFVVAFPNQSLSATNGSVFAALLAGSTHAISATVISTPATAATTRGSIAPVS